jgi:hypothetical protein
MPAEQSRRPFLRVGMVIVLFAFALAGVTSWYISINPCEADDVEQATALLIIQMRQYDNVYASAANGTRTSVEYPVTVMQQILVDTQGIEVPACMRTAKIELISYMRDAIHAFRAFQSEEPDIRIQGFLDSSYAHVRTFRIELDALKECVPYCMPWR